MVDKRKDKEEFYMMKAIKQAEVALRHGEVPIGAVVVDKEGNVLGRAYNKVEKMGCQIAHAEGLAIQKACRKVGGWRLNGCYLYVTLEPCLMCLGLIQLSRIERVIFGVKSNLFGSSLYECGHVPSYAKHLKLEGGTKARECVNLLKRFFNDLREKRKGYREAKGKIY